MTETVGKEIMLEGVDPRELYGAQDVNLEQIKSLHPTLKIVARGQSLKVLGPEADTQRFSKRMEGLAAYYVKYGHVSAEVIEQCFAGGIAQDDAPVDKDVIVYGNNGTIVRARTVNQLKLVQSYDRNDLLLAIGPAGSGKTYTAIALAVRALKEKQVRRIILTRPAVEAGERLGFLPGDLQNKVDPYLRPLYDGLFDLLGAETFQKLFEKQVIEVAPLAYMRGRTLDDAFIILDEAQNTTPEQMKMFLTRMGVGSKVVVTGDVTQIDLPDKVRSGLIDALHVLQDVEGIAQVRLTEKDVVRHRLVQQIVKAYEKAAEEKTRGEANHK